MNASLLQGTRNTRDLGVLLPGCGPRRLLRSDHLAALTQEDADRLRQWGIGCILDLRRPDEQLRQPTPAFVPARVVEVTIDNTPLFTVRRMDPTFRLGELYLHMLHVHGPVFARAVHLAAESLRQGQGVLFHCSAGKDRTGVTAALLLGLAGCEDADIVADYALTDIYLRPKVKLFLQHNPNADPALFRAPMESMDRFTAFVREEFGSARGYLKSLGFSDEELDQVWNPRR